MCEQMWRQRRPRLGTDVRDLAYRLMEVDSQDTGSSEGEEDEEEDEAVRVEREQGLSKSLALKAVDLLWATTVVHPQDPVEMQVTPHTFFSHTRPVRASTLTCIRVCAMSRLWRGMLVQSWSRSSRRASSRSLPSDSSHASTHQDTQGHSCR